MTTMEERWAEQEPAASQVAISPITPHLCVTDGAAAMEFYVRALAAEEVYRLPADDGKRIMNALVRINGASVMVNDDFPEMRGGTALGAPSGVTIHLAVDDTDRWFDRAVAAGAKPTMPPADMFWGDRYAQIIDPFGHSWSFGAPVTK